MLYISVSAGDDEADISIYTSSLHIYSELCMAVGAIDADGDIWAVEIADRVTSMRVEDARITEQRAAVGLSDISISLHLSQIGN